MSEHTVRAFHEQLRHLRRGEVTPHRLREAADLSLRLPPTAPAWAVEARQVHFDHLDTLLSNLPKCIEKLYNEHRQTVFVFCPDFFLAKVGYEAACTVLSAHQIARINRDSRGPGDVSALWAVFVPVLPYEQPASAFVAGSALLLNPGRFHSLQLKTVSDHLEQGARVVLWGSDHPERGGLSLAVRENDREKLDFLLARWAIEAAGPEKDKQLSYLLSFMEAMAEWVEYGAG